MDLLPESFWCIKVEATLDANANAIALGIIYASVNKFGTIAGL